MPYYAAERFCQNMNIEEICTGFQHLGLPTGNMDATLDFYKSIGFNTTYNTLNGSCRVAFLQLGNMVIETYEAETIAGKSGAIDHISLNVTDIETVFNWAKELGLRTNDKGINFLPFFENGVRFFTVIGPNEEKVEFNQIL